MLPFGDLALKMSLSDLHLIQEVFNLISNEYQIHLDASDIVKIKTDI